jgi:hypothetical protein
MRKNIVESKRLKRAMRAKSKRCYANAWDAVETQAEYQNATYVEGLVVCQSMVIEHGWIETEEEIVDPTLPTEDMVYFSGLRFKGKDGLDCSWKIPGFLESGMKLPIFYRFGWGGVNSPEFLQAIVRAYRFAGMDDVANSYLRATKVPLDLIEDAVRLSGCSNPCL